MSEKIKIVGISGSLRKGSFNTALLRAFSNLGEDFTVESAEIGNLPLFNQDMETNLPKAALAFKNSIKSADGILFVTPEYNYSIPGVLKNAIDWVSRPYGNNSFENKPAAIMSASGGMLGGARAQYHLRQMMVFLNMHPMNRPEFMLSFAPKKFDEKGNLIDEETKAKIKEFAKEFALWVKRIKSMTG
jgi:chromate reductase, NAD(P)H dehydrogenase (quinone)